MILTVFSFAFCFVKKRLAHDQSRSVPKTSLNASLHGLVELAITCVHDHMVVAVKVTKIYGKTNFNRWALAITAVPTTLTSRFQTTGYAQVLLFIFIRRELGGMDTGCLFQFTYCDVVSWVRCGT